MRLEDDENQVLVITVQYGVDFGRGQLQYFMAHSLSPTSEEERRGRRGALR